ncbi:uncharacterized protein EDB91DRAFT_1121785 [Suillus paluster]|uniref:uncharacterized protein n=1 Tax=Suillus paluster TaxID=48578 RepID=UPI001B87AABC|nr:uncharacterized protein EDB91DRAFT_1121785 [Suillus paluster]KAG1744951.1 hypothetical protein EDB91DRAFT_1121785 [Suillus paluster]
MTCGTSVIVKVHPTVVLQAKKSNSQFAILLFLLLFPLLHVALCGSLIFDRPLVLTSHPINSSVLWSGLFIHN